MSERKTNDENNVLKQQSIVNDFFSKIITHILTYSSLCSTHSYWRQLKASGNGYIRRRNIYCRKWIRKNNNNNNIFCQFSSKTFFLYEEVIRENRYRQCISCCARASSHSFTFDLEQMWHHTYDYVVVHDDSFCLLIKSIPFVCA